MGPESIQGGDEGQIENDLFARAQAGDQGAWRVLFNECYPKVRRVVRQRLKGGPLRRYIDSTDVANDVMAELAMNASRFQFDSIAKINAFLIDAAYKRVVDEYRRQTCGKRGGGTRNRPLPEGDADAWGISSGEPTPSAFASANELERNILAGAEDDTCRSVLVGRTEGQGNAEIAERTGWSLRKIQRYLQEKSVAFLN